MPRLHRYPGAAAEDDFMRAYLETLALVERLHRLLLDVVKDEFERLGIIDINSVQALLLFNVGDNEVTAGELKTRGYYQGSNVSYNLKKLVECGYMHHQKCMVDRRAVRVRLTEKGRRICTIISELFQQAGRGDPCPRGSRRRASRRHQRSLRGLERYWSDQIRYIY
jgi:DNA-binding MarR family transcriptional regulator